jgi:hypothetical protein
VTLVGAQSPTRRKIFWAGAHSGIMMAGAMLYTSLSWAEEYLVWPVIVLAALVSIGSGWYAASETMRAARGTPEWTETRLKLGPHHLQIEEVSVPWHEIASVTIWQRCFILKYHDGRERVLPAAGQSRRGRKALLVHLREHIRAAETSAADRAEAHSAMAQLRGRADVER